ncbi:hypothetical protein POTOM_017502 [Populus tomentosa]|uniref:MADS-box domain-containing protein n=1 Tax=Populus tomentosa TaxID=118781 RepID=A0A8X7ZX76_POPTO|nr:hypothetical protein POTOM_017502 [Populus tomentosa]
MEGKQTRGRQKIAIKRIENEDDRLITFSKRRSGIYKKASELVTLCGAEVAVLVFSPAGNAFSFGHPSIESVANRFLGQNMAPNDNTHPLVEAHRKVRINDLNQQHNELLSEMEAERDRGKLLKEGTSGKSSQGWWEAIDELSLQELKQMNVMLEEFHKNLHKKINELRRNGASCISCVEVPPGMCHKEEKMEEFGRFLNRDKKPKASAGSLVDSQQEARLEKLNSQLNDILRKLHYERKRGELLEKAMKLKGSEPKLIGELNLDELRKMKGELEELREKLRGRVTEMEASSSLLLLSKKPSREKQQ